MKIRFALMTWIALALTPACVVHDNPKELSYEMRHFDQSDGACGANGDNACGQVILEYPEFAASDGNTTADKLNRVIADLLLESVFDESPAASPDDLAEAFLGEWATARAEFPDAASTQTWSLTRQVHVIFEGPGAVTLAFEETEFTGGAHGSQLKHYTSFDPIDGRRLRLEDVLDDGYEARLATLAERRFREARGLAPDADLAQAGFAFDSRPIVPEGNFGIVDAGIVFRFNAYDIGPYSLGPTEFTVTQQDLGHLVR